MLLSQKSDIFGAMASSLCLIHCMITPFIFVAQTCSVTCCSSAPTWWRSIDIFFLIISFFAVYWSSISTSKQWLKISFWTCWIAMFMLIVNESLGWLHLPHSCIYVPSLGLVLLHIYNKKYCQCTDDACCQYTDNILNPL